MLKPADESVKLAAFVVDYFAICDDTYLFRYEKLTLSEQQVFHFS